MGKIREKSNEAGRFKYRHVMDVIITKWFVQI